MIPCNLQRADEVVEAAADAGGRQHPHQRGKEHRYHCRGCRSRHPRADDAWHDARRAVYHRTAQLSRGAAHELFLFPAGREDQPGANQRDPPRRGRERRGRPQNIAGRQQQGHRH